MKKTLSLWLFLVNFFFSSAEALFEEPKDARLEKLYQQINSEFLWLKDGQWTAHGTALLEALSHKGEEGLPEESFQILLENLKKIDFDSFKGQKEADELVTLAALTYVGEMKGKRTTPSAVDKTIHIKPPAFDEVDYLREYLTSSLTPLGLEKLAPQTETYRNLKKLLALYREKQKKGGWPKLPTGTRLQRGDKGPLVKILKAQLIMQDALSEGHRDGDLFDTTVEQALKTYQQRHALESDGRVGGATLKALNVPIEERIKGILITLERQRWLPYEFPATYLIVNIPGFYLKAVRNDQSLYMPIITGREYRKTPLFTAPLTEITFNPSWHVPPSIAGQDKLPKLQNNPHAFTAKGYHFYDSLGQEVSPGSINWGAYSKGHFPFRIVQSPGPNNALGKIRFTLESPFSIYMHGTPNTNLFQKAKRSLSSGCIRVQDPIKLAEFVFNDEKNWSSARIAEAASGTRTRRSKLPKSLPVFVVYETVFQDKQGDWCFVDDEYGQDKKLWTALENNKHNPR